MIHSRFIIIVSLGLVSIALPVAAQSPAAKPTAPLNNAATRDESDDTAEARLARERRAQARSLLISLASDASSFRDQRLRARSLARIADALWSVDAEQSRVLFRKAWEAAELADVTSDQKVQEEIRRQTATGGGYAINLPPKMRPEIWQLAERHDHILGEEFRHKLEAKESATTSSTEMPSAPASDAAREDQPQPVDAYRAALPIEIDSEKSLLNRIDRAKTSEERDGLYFQLAFAAIGRGDLRARDFADKIEDLEFRKQARPFVDANLVMRAIEKKQTDKALQLAQTGELSHIQRTWVLARAARLLAETDGQKARSLVEDALLEARRIDGKDPDRPRGLLAVANALLIVDHDLVWDATFEAVKAANSADGFTGEDGELNLQFKFRGSNAASTHAEPDFDLKEIFGTLANEDYYRTVGLARGFQGEAPRANATITIAQSVLNEKPALRH